MKDYIEREAVLELLRYWADGYSYIEAEAAWAIRGITAIPTADVKPVVRGRWEIEGEFANCTVCKKGFRIECDIELFDEMPHFCPNCGADMRGEN